ncbi:MAG: hypothetical protein IPH57_12875 [Saprospiraceae bacterium]|nr:hypothetical protein [Saprospiraceae bacterium]
MYPKKDLYLRSTVRGYGNLTSDSYPLKAWYFINELLMPCPQEELIQYNLT